MFSIGLPREKYTIYTYRIKHIGVREGNGEGHVPPKILEIFFSGKWQTCGHFDNFSGKYQVKFEHFVDFS